MLEILRQVQAEAQKRHKYVSDQDQYGKVDHWEPGLMGDCEDYALWCRERLEAEGIQSDLIYCITENGGGHLVVSVDGWILDNRHKDVVSRNDLDYQWIAIGQPDGTWYQIDNTPV